MIETLTTSLGGASLLLLNGKRLSPFTSTGKVYLRGRKSCNALFYAIEADPAVHTTFKRRSSLYEVLRVKCDATSNEIKAAYRNLAKLYHPDSSDLEQHDDRKFIEIHDAYVTLCNPADRAIYDLKLNMGLGQRSGSYTTIRKRREVYTSQRWETDQCW